MASQLLLAPPQIVAVDVSSHDYHLLVTEADARDVAWLSFPSAEELLRGNVTGDVLCWIVHSDLPDARGVQLLGHLPRRDSFAPVMIVSDEYDAKTELEVLRSGLAHYACKPLSVEWFTKLVAWPKQRQPAGRRRMATSRSEV